METFQERAGKKGGKFMKKKQMKRPFEITADAILWFLLGSLIIFFDFVLFFFLDGTELLRFSILLFCGLFSLILGYGLWTGKSWAYISFFIVIILFICFLFSEIAEVRSGEEDFDVLTIVKWVLFLLIIISEIRDIRKPQIREYLKRNP